MRTRAPFILLAILVVWGCGDDPKPIQSFTTSTGGTTQVADSSAKPDTNKCGDYCQYIVNTGTGCGSYNHDSHCLWNCNYYYTTPCSVEWHAFQECIIGRPIACIETSLEWPAMDVTGCSTERDTLDQCLTEHDAGACTS